MGISTWLREMLKEGRYKNAVKMAEAFGVTEPAVIYWLHGQRRPSVNSCRRIAEATDTPIAEVVLMATIGGDGEAA